MTTPVAIPRFCHTVRSCPPGAAHAALASVLGLVTLAAGACDKNELGHLEAPKGGDLTHAPAPRAPFDTRSEQACGPGGATPEGSLALVRHPYVQRVTADSAAVLWVADDASSGEPVTVEVTRPDGTVVTTAQARVDDTARPQRGTQYVASLSGLDANATLCYRLAGDPPWTRPTGFRTAPEPGSDATVRLVAIGDTGARTGDQDAVLEQLRTVEFDLAVITGDVAYESGTRAQLEANFFTPYRDLTARAAFFPASGNHDYRTSDAQPFREAFALFENGGDDGRERWYSLDWGNVHIVVVDTERVCPAQIQWLEADLARNQLPWVLAVGHKPPYSSGHHGSDSDVRDAFAPIFEEHGVALGLFGHEHSYERTGPVNGVTYVITGGGGRGTRSVGTSSFTAFSAQVAHFVYVIIDGTTLRLHAIDATGADFDTLELTLPATDTSQHSR